MAETEHSDERGLSAFARQADEAVRKRILETLNKKRQGRGLLCSICGVRDWIIGYYSPIPIAPDPTNMGVLAAKMYPTVTLVCQNCGNTHFLNLRILGFSEADLEELKLTLAIYNG